MTEDGTVTAVESGQLDLVDTLREGAATADETLADLDGLLNVNIDANPDDKLLMELFDVLTDARESLREFLELLDTMAQRDRSEG